MLYAEVAVEAARALDRDTYTYAVPERLQLVPGHRVLVPFGRRRSVGYVVELHSTDPGLEVREVESADPQALLLPHQLSLARQVATHCWAPLIECLRVMLPPRVRGPGRSGGAGPSPRQSRRTRLLELAQPSAPPAPGPTLTPEQAQALEVLHSHRATLVHGVAGSGKTELYLEVAAETLAEGLRVLVLVPEISLTPQLVERFSRRLGVPLAVLHSQLTELERAQQWWRVRRGEAQVVVGSRSAVFAPVPRLGLVVVDEEGSSSYKEERIPRYEAGWVASRLAELTGARLVLGSASPSLVAYHQAVEGRLALAELPRRIRGHQPRVELVDMRAEQAAGNRMPLSRPLVEALDRTLEGGEQAILFLNRRGAATFLLCRECGSPVQCPHCSVSLVQHLASGPDQSEALCCHYCGHRQPLPLACPRCGSLQIRGLGTGTQRLEGLVRRLWPAARVLRLDRDTARSPDAYFTLLQTFAARKADVLVGTQLVARGLDLEAVSTVGVVDADLPLHFPDYRSAEAAFRMVTQVAGRAGRWGRPAEVVVQTWNPEHYCFRYALAGDYRAFYLEEMPSRRAFQFPPCADLAVLTCRHRDPERAAATAAEAAEELASALLREGIEGVRVLGPSPAFPQRLRGEYRWQLTLKGERLERVRSLVPRGRGWSYDVDALS